uniref:Uncharacterized protein n=1 Tax=Arundo donax TaxID=35708 RepID=A0A0A9FHL3_ARUDO
MGAPLASVAFQVSRRSSPRMPRAGACSWAASGSPRSSSWILWIRLPFGLVNLFNRSLSKENFLFKHATSKSMARSTD